MLIRTLVASATLALAVGPVMAQCQAIGWVLVDQRSISATERLCVYEKNGARVSIMVSGFCPFSPC